MIKALTVYTIGNLYKLKWIGGGEIPPVLAGGYTSERAACEAGEKYIANRPPKPGEKRAKSKRRA